MDKVFYKVVRTVGQADADMLVKTAFNAGVNLFDTADVYSGGESEQTLGRAIKNLNLTRKDILIATKAYSRVGQSVNDMGASEDFRYSSNR